LKKEKEEKDKIPVKHNHSKRRLHDLLMSCYRLASKDPDLFIYFCLLGSFFICMHKEGFYVWDLTSGMA
jgi:hypothetical protein